METNTQVPLQAFVAPAMESTETTSAGDARVSDVDVIRSEYNILQWMSYLPEDCVRTMILMGWDVTT
jgi:hypothetical protein